MAQPTISIITINYRQPEATVAFLQSLKRQSYQDYEVILVDNAPLVDSEAAFKAAFPEVLLIVNTENIGFAAANNQGIHAAKGSFFFLLNNDTEVSEGLFESCLELFQDKTVGAVSPMLRYYDKPELIQYAGFTPVDWLGRNKLIGQYTVDQGQYTTVRPTPYAHGAAMMLRRLVWREVGDMPEDYFLYYEELAWCEEIRRAGYQILVNPNAKVFHKASLSTGRGSKLKTYYLNKNRIVFMMRYAKPWVKPIFATYIIAMSAPVKMAKYLLSGNFSFARAYMEAIRDGFFRSKRKAYIRKSAPVKPVQMEKASQLLGKML